MKAAPRLLSGAAAAGVFDQAVRDAEAAGRLGDFADLMALPGHRRRLRRRLRDWTEAEHHRAEEAPDDLADSPEWAVFVAYRRLLARLDAEDEAGLSVWGSIRLRDRPAGASAGAGDRLVFLDFDGRSPARRRVLRDALSRPRLVDATLAHVDDPALGEVHLATDATRDLLLKLGMVETRLPSSPDRPAGLRAVEENLFRPSPAPAGRIDAGTGLAIRGGPEGEDLARLVAREVRSLIDQGTDPDDLLIVFPQWDDQADVVCETLRGAGLPVHDAAPRALDQAPSIAALLQAARVPLEDWETELVIRLLRNGQVRPAWDEADGLGLAEAAAALRDASVFRGSRQILAALERAMARTERTEDDSRNRERLERVHRIIERLIAALGSLDEPRPWPARVSALKAVAAELGLGARDGRALEALWDALDDQADVWTGLDRDGEAVGWAEFVAAAGSLAAETPQPRSEPAAGSIRTASVDAIDGARAAFVLLVGLVEGSFPRRSTAQRFLATRPGEEPSNAARRGHAEEMLRFLRVLGAADRGAFLFYPTTDAKGQPLLRAGFLDELLGALAPTVAATVHQSRGRFHPALLDAEDLAVSPADRLILAAALAAGRDELDGLRALAADPTRAEAAAGAAAALRALDGRRRGTPLGRYEGKILGEAAIAEIAKTFNEAYPFSPSQLETYLNCPYQFFARHVLHLKAPEERDELDEDLTERGSRLHDILEKLEKRTLEAGDDSDANEEEIAAAALAEVRDRLPDDPSELARSLRRIEFDQLARIIGRYLRQRAKYRDDPSAPAVPKHLEYDFGSDKAGTGFAIEAGSEVVRLRGRIDRVDLIETAAGLRFRVIDYKSGAPPSGKDVTEGRMLQLPLYAMAVERLLFGGESALGPPDVGYWGLGKDGYKSIALKEEWDEIKRKTAERVLEVIHRVRSGEFVVAPRREHCETYCEYRSICRVRQIRAAGKTREEE